jgi:hypothetical protein
VGVNELKLLKVEERRKKRGDKGGGKQRQVQKNTGWAPSFSFCCLQLPKELNARGYERGFAPR